MKTIIFDFNRTLHNPDTGKIFPDVRRILRTLKSRGYVLQLISRQESRRQKNIDDLAIAEYFTTILLTAQKSRGDFARLVGDSDVTFVVGDRVREEIVIGNQLGCITIWFRTGKFRNQIPITQQEKPTYIITRLSELLKIID